MGRCKRNAQRIQTRLRHSDYLSLRNVGCEAASGGVVLWGSVPSYYMKQLAQSLAGEIVGLEKVKNRIQVHLNLKAR